jgi:F-type H+-transporting ATPase subunit b
MKHAVLAIALVAGLSSLAAAQVQPSPEGGPGYPPPDVPEQHHGPVITNWWDWHNRHPPPFGYALVNFGIFAAILYKLAAKPLRTFVAERHDRIAKDLDEAARLCSAAEEQLREYERKVQNVDAEVDALLKQIHREAETEKARIIAAAEEQARALKREAEKQIQAEIGRAREELRRTMVDASVQTAEQLVKDQIGSDDQRRMAERYVADLEQRSSGPPARRS